MNYKLLLILRCVEAVCFASVPIRLTIVPLDAFKTVSKFMADPFQYHGAQSPYILYWGYCYDAE